MTEEYNEFGEIKQERKLDLYDKHRVHRTKDIFEADCALCQADMKKHVKTYWSDDD